MISCTEFIPLYSAFFTFLESRDGHEAVVRYWEYLSERNIGDTSNPHSLASFVERYGFEGTWWYWSHTLSEEACDILRIYDPKARHCVSHMRHCPSKGMLLALSHVEPYHDYCAHCALIYDRVLRRYGMRYENFGDVDNTAQCRGICYMEGSRPGEDAWVITPEKIVMDMRADDNQYLHRDFHLLGDLALTYCGEQYGEAGVHAFLTGHARAFYGPVIDAVRAEGLPALERWLRRNYDLEEASDLLHTAISGDVLHVQVAHSPVIAYMETLGQRPGPYYIEQTRTLYKAIADGAGIGFALDAYQENGAARMRFGCV